MKFNKKSVIFFLTIGLILAAAVSFSGCLANDSNPSGEHFEGDGHNHEHFEGDGHDHEHFEGDGHDHANESSDEHFEGDGHDHSNDS